jgi:hypothetical protein
LLLVACFSANGCAAAMHSLHTWQAVLTHVPCVVLLNSPVVLSQV